jgi:hypothetical protein
MRVPFHWLPTLAVSIAVLLFVAWASLVAGGRQSLYADTPPAASAG